MKRAAIIALPSEEARLRRKIRRHFQQLGFTKGPCGELVLPGTEKDTYRELHAHRRKEKFVTNREWIACKAGELMRHLASGEELNAAKIKPRIEVVRSKTWQADLFRLATYYWRIPTSDGYGRRMRFLVWDSYHERLIGIFALGDAVFNLEARDKFIGWNHHRRTKALVNLMDAYVLGAVPPYNMLLGGKLVASLIQTRDIVETFKEKYSNSVGVISGERKKPRLVAVTTTSALGRSSMYNRLRIGEEVILRSIGYSSGWGHFHISDSLFEELRNYLESIGDSYASSHGYGEGPNFKLRVIKRALACLGMSPDLARHGLTREVFFSSLAKNALEVLRGEHTRVHYKGLRTVEERGNAALWRWVVPRSIRLPKFRQWRREEFLKEISLDGEGTGKQRSVRRR